MDINYILVFLILAIVSGNLGLSSNADPTDGFTQIPLNRSNFHVQKPYNARLQDRYSHKHGIFRLWVYNNDKPHSLSSHTKPRTEIRISGLDYTSGIWQFEGLGYVPNGTTGASIMQVFGANRTATTFMLRMIDGDLRFYNRDIIEKDMYDKWFRLNVIHQVEEGKVTVFIDGVQRFVTKENKGPGKRMYFKCGVYGTNMSSHYMESQWAGIKIYRKLS